MGRSGAGPLRRIRREERPALEGGPYKPIWAWRSSVELAARRTRGAFARIALIWLFRFFGVVAALFAAADTAMGPQTFEDHFSGGRGGAGVLGILHAESADVLHQ